MTNEAETIIKRLEMRVNELEKRVAIQEDIEEVKNLMGKYEVWHVPNKVTDTWQLFAMKTPDVSAEIVGCAASYCLRARPGIRRRRAQGLAQDERSRRCRRPSSTTGDAEIVPLHPRPSDSCVSFRAAPASRYLL